MPGSVVTSFLARFSSVKKSGGQFMVVCPGHADKGPSLAIKEGNDGSVLLHCHAGCPTDRVLAAMGLEESVLFDEAISTAPKRTIQTEYSYHDEDGKLLFQCIRYHPKGFGQRRPDGKGGWLWNLQGTRRVLYRLPELLGQNAIIFCEGEKDVDRAWTLGMPATCNPMGAGKWDPSYAQQLTKAGVKRVAIVQDNDAPGKAHADAVRHGLQLAGLKVRVITLPGVPEHGDLSDYFGAGHTKEEFLELVKTTDEAAAGPVVTVADPVPAKVFTELGEQRYKLEVNPDGVVIEVSRLRRASQELIGELVVRVNGHFPNARTFQDGVLNAGDLNFSSVQARSTRAKLLGERAGDKSADWFGYLEEFVTTVIAAERRGKPAIALADTPEPEEQIETWDIGGWPLLKELPMVLFGDSASGKSYFAMWIAGKLAEEGIPVLYADWEFSQIEHRKRLSRLFQPMPKGLLYVRCDQPLRHETDHLIDIAQKHKCQYIICDSIGFAVEGPAESQEGASAYFRHLRQLKIGSLSIAHIPKQYGDNQEAQVFGSVFFRHGARSIWFIERASENPPGELRFGLYHRKNNTGEKLAPRGYKLIFRGARTLIEPVDVQNVDELAAALPAIDRIRRFLKEGPATPKQIGEELNLAISHVRAVLSRHKSQFLKLGTKIHLSKDAPVEDNANAGIDF